MAATLSGTFSGTGTSATIVVGGLFNFSISGIGTATVVVERSFDNGSTWKIVETFTSDAERRGEEPEILGLPYRVRCTSFSSGTILYRLSARR